MLTDKTTQKQNIVPFHNCTVSKMRKATYLIQPVGLMSDVSSDYWIHMEFEFNAQKSEVEVAGYWVTDSAGAEILLSELSFQDLQFVMQAMNEEFEYQTKTFYDELESSHYESVKGGYNE